MADALIQSSTEDRMEFPQDAASRLLREAGLPDVLDWSPVRGGANNRVYCGTAGPKKVLLKMYFGAEGDPRDRLGGERCFYSLAEKANTHSVPQALGWDLANRLALFEFVEGRKLEAGEITAAHVLGAANLVAAVNNLRDRTPSESLASEACFSISEHLSAVDARVERLGGLEISDPLDREASAWIHEQLKPAWHRVHEAARAHAVDEGLDPSDSLPQNQRWISPSDFGFHNALLETNGRLRFFDFEYAGWDDPAKLMADFFCQPAIPVPLGMWSDFLGGLAECRHWHPETALRARVLLPAYRIKWCCIMMNEFLSSEARRRRFSGLGTEDRRATQLAKARAALCEIGTQPSPRPTRPRTHLRAPRGSEG